MLAVLLVNLILAQRAKLTHSVAMSQSKVSAKRKRKNIMMPEAVIAIGEGMAKARYFGGNKFSQLLTDLVLEEEKRQASGGAKSQEQYLTQIVDLLEKNKALEAKLKEKTEGFKLERKGMTEALALCEEDLKKAKSSGA